MPGLDLVEELVFPVNALGPEATPLNVVRHAAAKLHEKCHVPGSPLTSGAVVVCILENFFGIHR